MSKRLPAASRSLVTPMKETWLPRSDVTLVICLPDAFASRQSFIIVMFIFLIKEKRPSFEGLFSNNLFVILLNIRKSAFIFKGHHCHHHFYLRFYVHIYILSKNEQFVKSTPRHVLRTRTPITNYYP